MSDYSKNRYLSSTEVASYLGIKVKKVQELIKNNIIPFIISTSGQYRISIEDIKKIEKYYKNKKNKTENNNFEIEINNTIQKIFLGNSQNMRELKDDSIHLVITSPPYFNAKMYSHGNINNDLGNIHDINNWFNEIRKVWEEVYRVIQPGRKFFLNIMNLPIRENGSFRTINLVGKSIDLCENIGFIFKRDIVWHKTNGVKAHFGTYPYPGGILINNMHEFILEFQKPNKKNFNKYAHLSEDIKENSKIDKEFWLSLKNSDVWLMKPEKSGDARKHIAPFPYDLPYRLIKAYSYISETILDPFCGSGTTLIAAKNLGRNGIGYEINPDFITVINKRFKEEMDTLF